MVSEREKGIFSTRQQRGSDRVEESMLLLFKEKVMEYLEVPGISSTMQCLTRGGISSSSPARTVRRAVSVL